MLVYKFLYTKSRCINFLLSYYPSSLINFLYSLFPFILYYVILFTRFEDIFLFSVILMCCCPGQVQLGVTRAQA
ncbi:hypothetical protein Pint_36247 [Pistacia integerrima]|uniref:Uncharacterized protein n=1 Tax=Pistacia integerrima TaxID=434235 RepID=A0ACC0Y0L5_9ROSI|nr:hypothetical protein Pint_36247 [Pistacia integerrima]